MGQTRKNRQLAFALVTACGMGAACAADPGDASKIISQVSGNSGSSGGASGAQTVFGTSGSTTGAAASGSATGSPSSGSISGEADASSDAASANAADATVTPTPLEVDYFTIDSPDASETQIQFDLQVVNLDANPVDLANVTLRYWFTNDGNAVSGLYFQSYYAQNTTTYAAITDDVSGVFAAAPSANVSAVCDTYLEISFTATAGQLGSDKAGIVQVDIRGPGANGYSDTFNETNDYSFDATKTTYAPWPHVTAYVGGQLVWGVEPGTGLTAGAPDAASAGDGASNDGQAASIDATGQETGAPLSDSAASDARTNPAADTGTGD